MTKFLHLLVSIILLGGCQYSRHNNIVNQSNRTAETFQESLIIRSVTDNLLTSDSLPNIQIQVENEFKYIGKFDFEIIASSDEYPEDLIGSPVAAGERLVFAVADEDNRVEKLFIVQFEGFLSTNDFVYNYNFDNADLIGNNKYRHNTWYYNGKVSINENPLGEWARTESFLKEKGFALEDDIMMSRFVGLASKDRKNELIIFYHEMLKKSTGYSLSEWEDTVPAEEISSIDSVFVHRSKSSFTIIKG